MTDIEFIRDLNSQKPIDPPEKYISSFISNNRIMPAGTPFPGPVDLTLTPYAIEWMDNMSPYSPVQHQVIMKAAQVAATFAIECIIGYWMKAFPTAILYMSATQALLEKWGTKRLEPMIDSCGIREKIIENAESQFAKKTRRTGDKQFSKLFVGGFLEMASAQAAASQRSDSIRLLIRDETDGAKKELNSGEGSWIKTSSARTKFWGERKKITDLSTPTIDGESYIEPAYQLGDKRHYMIPCPHCHKHIWLEPIPEHGEYGLRGKYNKQILQEVFYVCSECGKAIYDKSKYEMLNSGMWEATAISHSPTYRSYYINSLYSPPRTVSWRDYYEEWKTIELDPENERGFMSLWAGRVYTETGSRPKIDSINHLRGLYNEMTIPDGVLYLTAAIDVQRGSDKYKDMNADDLQLMIDDAKDKGRLENFPRLEMEILGHGGGYRTWSICYKRFEGHLNDIQSGAWEKLTDFFIGLAKTSDIVRSGYKVPAIMREDGMYFDIPLVFIDARDGIMRDTVYSYCQKYGFYPSMGHNPKNERYKKAGDVETRADTRPWKLNRANEDLMYYVISTNYYKNAIYKRAKIERTAVGKQRPGFMDHPKGYNEHYFEMLFAEEHRKDGSFHDGGRRNEALDCKTYNLCAGEVYLDMLVNHWRTIKQNEGYSLQKVRNDINTLWVLTWLENKTQKIKIATT